MAWSRAGPRTRFSRAVITAVTFTGFESTAVYRREAPVWLTGTGGSGPDRANGVWGGHDVRSTPRSSPYEDYALRAPAVSVSGSGSGSDAGRGSLAARSPVSRLFPSSGPVGTRFGSRCGSEPYQTRETA